MSTKKVFLDILPTDSAQNLHYEISHYSVVTSEVIMSNHSALCFGRIGYVSSTPGSFLFSLRNNDDLGPFKALLNNGHHWTAILRCNSYGPLFGFYELGIVNNAGLTDKSYANLGETYQAPPGYTAWEPNT